MSSKKFIISTAAVFSFFIFINGITANDDKQHGYIGAKACGMCHAKEKEGAQLKIWQESRHAKAYETLNSEEADNISLELYGKKAIETEECLVCHTSGYDAEASLIGKKFKLEDGVQCETCHGAGSDYKSLKIMKDKEQSAANGLKVFSSENEIKDLCITCHNEESPTYVAFRFKEMWQQISHNIPEKK